MSEKLALLGVTVLMAGALSACGQKGPLYLPDAPGEIVTRPVATPPPAPAPESPSPEVASPEGPPQEQDPRKEKSAAPPPPQ